MKILNDHLWSVIELSPHRADIQPTRLLHRRQTELSSYHLTTLEAEKSLELILIKQMLF